MDDFVLPETLKESFEALIGQGKIPESGTGDMERALKTYAYYYTQLCLGVDAMQLYILFKLQIFTTQNIKAYNGHWFNNSEGLCLSWHKIIKGRPLYIEVTFRKSHGATYLIDRRNEEKIHGIFSELHGAEYILLQNTLKKHFMEEK